PGAELLDPLALRLGIDAPRHGDAALDRRTRGDGVDPAAQVRKVVHLDARPGVDADPRPGGDVGDRVVAGQELTLGEARVQHAIETLRLALVALDRVVDLLRGVAEEDVRLSLHRPDAAHL